jgi:hypothetical protein
MKKIKSRSGNQAPDVSAEWCVDPKKAEGQKSKRGRFPSCQVVKLRREEK